MACQRFSAPTKRIRLFHSSAQQALLFFLNASKPTSEAKQAGSLVIRLTMKCTRNQARQLSQFKLPAAVSPGPRILAPQSLTIQRRTLRFCLIPKQLGGISEAACRHCARAFPKQ